MPYLDIFRDDDYVSFWYTTNSLSGHVSGFDPAKPTILFLHPTLLDTEWLNLQFGDPRLDRHYNLFAFDRRAAGKTLSRFNARRDTWTDAVDIALICSELCLYPVHVWASGVYNCDVAARFSILFPEMCLSLTLVTVGPSKPETTYRTGDELMHMWGNADDLETLEFALFHIVQHVIGTDVDTDLADELIAHFETTYPPFRAARLSQTADTLINRSALTRTELNAITVPCLLIHGEKDPLFAPSRAETMASRLVNARGAAKVVIIKGGRAFISVVPEWTSIANRVFAQFLATLPPTRTPLALPPEPLDARLRRALHTLADLLGDPAVASDARAPLSSMSFSRASRGHQQQTADLFRMMCKKQRGAFSPLSSNGRPIRRYSERRHDHWFQADRYGMSYVTSNLSKPKHQDERAASNPALAENGTAPRGDARAHPDTANGNGPTPAPSPAPLAAVPTAVRDVAPVKSAFERLSFSPSALGRVDQAVLKSGVQRATATIPLGKLLARQQ